MRVTPASMRGGSCTADQSEVGTGAPRWTPAAPNVGRAGLLHRRPHRNKGWVPGLTGGNGQRQPITLTASAFRPKFVVIFLGSAKSLTLKGLTGGTGIPLTPCSHPLEVDALFPLGSVSSFGITSGSASVQTVVIIFL